MNSSSKSSKPTRRTRPPRIAIRNRQNRLRPDPPFLRRVVREAWSIQPPASRIPHRELSLVFVTDAEIAALNARFLGHDGPTDVITFDHGEIVISTGRALAHARRFRTPVHEELALYIIHGLLHLDGWDDRTAADRRAMVRRQAGILRAIRKKLDLRRLLR